ncbi:alanine racemase [Methanococcus maripaludis C5]|uniref:Alanine racemase n=1 Tax=Methanococcus maripaludis (strain C5 / ATCC BAA-1333) TaxID=402880 RepID=A4FW09_METM5|nr:alanine racemase [Methanococcus maripaludis]ABO34380.1 alanine racemase [Methanococcus maripaludis C5]
MVSHPIWAEIDLSAIKNNIEEIRRITNPKSQVMAVVKANAYGHGAVEVSKVCLENGADRLAVARSTEALELRNAGITCPILVFGYCTEEEIEKMVENDITLTVYSFETASSIQKTAEKLGKHPKIHIKVDTGMSRLGFLPRKDAVETIQKIMELENIEVEGIYTHFADADNSDKTYTTLQFSRFTNFLHDLEENEIFIPIKHASNSAAIIDHPETHLNLVRPGIILYGLYPSELVHKERINLKPAMSLKVLVTHVKEVPENTKISYGCTFETKKPSKIASLPIGYADGFTRMLKNGYVLIHGSRVPVIGRICMDQCMIDVSYIENVQVGDVVTIFGTQENETIPIEEFGEKLGTINYELVCMVASRVPRKYLQ